MTILVAYATYKGSTQEIAHRLAARMREQGLVVDVRPVVGAGDITHYDSVVVGSAVHGGRWLPEAERFVDEAAPVLRRRPTWLFSVGTVGDNESMFSPWIARGLIALRRETPEVIALRRATRARGHRNFAGVIAPGNWPLLGRLVFRAMGGRYGDHRNWAAIDQWADSIATEVTHDVRKRAVGLRP